ncbi:malectin domain-containing carbohydrate-binding protein [Mucilaginibacter sabulilitoris]|uniref:Malectin domain-containing carbohydrate-binding protein n=1 Tax=Mucilaginibacter sabulilitoris TaxID=1173583 RepID=A0ABZ0TJ05_9SPHI|nr:malectin domain-containing carbohydrate-binding protein [Mucilaginibacter sabulilitoris]WPU92392.1 malectin domain-containing carbohydrate-binding protein [Mucilaginibacter sabulilitoris]
MGGGIGYIKTRVSGLKHQLAIVLFIGLLPAFMPNIASAQQNTRQDILLNTNWHTIADEQNSKAYAGFEQAGFSTKTWLPANIPHNWDTYEGYRRLKHGNKHGYAWYRKVFALPVKQTGKRYFLWFEGVGSYATVWLNGRQVGYHAGGRTTFTLDVTDVIKAGKQNLLAVRADHPAYIKDLPWVCGGCSDETGFSEGSQPMGIFRPVHLIVTNPVRIEPFGVHIWNDTTVSEKSATLNLETEIKNYGNLSANVKIVNILVDEKGKSVAQTGSTGNVESGDKIVVKNALKNVKNIHLWSLNDPYLYNLITQIWENGTLKDQIKTPYGIRWISWPIGRNNGDNRFYLNGKPVFINGVAEYEHLMGKSQAFSNAEIKSRVTQVKAAGFNAFRDAHQPHNLEYNKYWDKLGILWWPQYSAHIWFNSPEFRANYKALLVDWIKERRNSPSVILWGLQNESKLPTDFARECSELIRKLDPTASFQRKITTCNGGSGTDWDVPQNWTGTYGGNPLTYGEDLKKQVLVGEYGAWRSLGLHTEGAFNQNGPLSEDRLNQLMETKVRLAESVKDQVAGHFQWLLYSHENPGRIQGGEGQRELDRVGPINYKGLFTPWGQPTDAFYMYRANYAPKDRGPMVYIVSHTWPNRWLTAGKKDSITVYSNCDEVELFNDVEHISLGKKKRGGVGTHFQWDAVDIKYNVLYAIGYVNGKAVTHDQIVLNHLPTAPHLKTAIQNTVLLKPAAGYNYLYRINCGGPDYKDSYGNIWVADKHQDNKKQTGSLSWTDDYPGMPAFFASQQRTFDHISGTKDEALFQTFRYGMDKLRFNFPVPDGDYRVEFYFTEPWYGTGGGMDCTGWRLFDVAVNGITKIKNLDIFKEAGYANAMKKTVAAHVTGGTLTVSFPDAEAGEAIISAIAVSSLNPIAKSGIYNHGVIEQLKADKGCSVQSWLDIGQKQYADNKITFSNLPPVLYGADWIRTNNIKSVSSASFKVNADADVFVAMDADPQQRPAWLSKYEVTGQFVETDADGGHKLAVYRQRFKKGDLVSLGENKGKYMYTVIVLPVTTLEPATDLRKTVSYKTETAELKGDGIVKDTLNGKNVVRFTKDGSNGVSFPVTPGVGAMYALRIKYYNQTDKTFTAKMQLLAADGTLMNEENISFKPVPKNKSGTVATTTGTSINAGNYKLVITGIQATGLCISGIEMQ